MDYYFVWASFDGTTNDPVVYPDGKSIQNLEKQILVHDYSDQSADRDKRHGFPGGNLHGHGRRVYLFPGPHLVGTGCHSRRHRDCLRDWRYHLAGRFPARQRNPARLIST